MAVVRYPTGEAVHDDPYADAPDIPPDEPPSRPAPISVFGDRWVNLADRPEILNDAPTAQRWLLKHYRDQRDHGVFPRGRAGIFAATGGVGKTNALVQLAIAVAAGGFWFGFRVAEPGHVLLALGEEDLDEARRRLWRAANAAGLTPEGRSEVAGRIDLLPLHGVSVALSHSPAPGVYLETELAAELRKRLNDRGVDWALVIVDPLSRFAGGGAEVDNEAATRFCQIVESLTTVRGNPSVLVAHHSSKASAKGGESDSRGVTAIRDGFRWMATMDPVVGADGTRGVLLRNRKSNYSPEFPDVVLVRNGEQGIEGTLRLATDTETSSLAPEKAPRAVVDEDVMRGRVLETVRRHPGLKSASKIAELTQGTKAKVLDAVKGLRSDGRLDLTEAGFSVREEGDKNS